MFPSRDPAQQTELLEVTKGDISDAVELLLDSEDESESNNPERNTSVTKDPAQLKYDISEASIYAAVYFFVQYYVTR